MTLLPGNAQHIGDREDQQDSFGFSDFNDHALVAHGGCLMVLADGMGGLADGAAASQAGVERFLAAYGAKPPAESIGDALSRGLAAAQHAVAGCSPEPGGAGSTLVAAVVHRDLLYWISLGDSRLYLCRGTAPAMLLTTDHNLRNLLAQKVERGELAVQELSQAGNLEALTEYLGSPHLPSPALEAEGMQLQPGDIVIACSDGLYRALSPEQMTQIMAAGDVMTGAEQLVEAVLRLRMPHQDNITVAALQLPTQPADAPLPSRKPFNRSLLLGILGGWASLAVIAAALLLFHVFSFAPHHNPPPVVPAKNPVAPLVPSKPSAVSPAPAPAPSPPRPDASQLSVHHPPHQSLTDTVKKHYNPL